jgi:hypothetical protein
VRELLFSSLLVFVFLFSANAQAKFDLPAGAMIIEIQPINASRSLVLWMRNPQKKSRDAEEEIYTCPEYTRGNYYHGKLQISLVNTKTQKIINSVEINDGDQPDGSFDVPYLIQRFYYKVPVINAKKEGKPRILSLQDFNGDGKPYEFAMYDALACQGLNTALFGYSQKQDKVIQYPIELTTGGKTETVYWIDYLYSIKPATNGVWKYEIDYRGRGGSLDKYEIRYDKQKEIFVGNLTSTDTGND